MGPNIIKTQSAFTLAEVLITLAVIGVVASLTVPTLMNNINNALYKAAWKKVYADLNQAFKQIVTDNSGNITGIYAGDELGSEKLKDDFAVKLNVIKNCKGTSSAGGMGSGAVSEGCWHESNSFYKLYGEVYTTTEGFYPGLILSNGALILVKNNSTNCSVVVGDYTKCARLWVDVNGFKSPNTFGKDIFGVNLTTKAVIPKGARGLYDPNITCVEGSTSVDNTGKGCSAKYLYE